MLYARTVAYALAGAAWLLVDFVTWRTHGALASSSLADVVRLARAHEAEVSAMALVSIAALPITAAALAALSAWSSRVVAGVRLVLALAGAGLSIGLLISLRPEGSSSLGPGAWLAIAGLVCAAVGAVFDGAAVASRRRPIESAP